MMYLTTITEQPPHNLVPRIGQLQRAEMKLKNLNLSLKFKEPQNLIVMKSAILVSNFSERWPGFREKNKGGVVIRTYKSRAIRTYKAFCQLFFGFL